MDADHRRRIEDRLHERMGLTMFSLAQESDRGLILVGHCLVEEALLRNLWAGMSGRLKKREIDSLMRGGLATYASRLSVARAMETITRETYEDGNTLRKLRNDCAHQPTTISLADPRVTDRLKSLHIYPKAHDPEWNLGGVLEEVSKEDVFQIPNPSVERLGIAFMFVMVANEIERETVRLEHETG